MSKDRTAQFLAQMGKGQGGETEPPASSAPVPASQAVVEAVVHEMPRPKREPVKAKPAAGRANLKHFGSYQDDETLEKIALLRIRLKMDNSALTKHAVDELYRKHNAKRAFGDA